MVGVGGSFVFLGVCVGSLEDCVGTDIVVVCVDRSVLFCPAVLDVLGVGVLVASGYDEWCLGSGTSSPSLKLVHNSIDTRLIRFGNIRRIRSTLGCNQGIGQLRSPIDRMDRSIDNRTLTHLLSESGGACKTAQVLRNPHTIRERNGSRGRTIGCLECNAIQQSQLGRRTCQSAHKGIPCQTGGRIRACKVDGSPRRTCTGYRNGVDGHLLNPVRRLHGASQSECIRCHPQRKLQG